MSKSNAKKQREKWQREGFRNPEENRGSWGQVKPVTRKTPTRLEAIRKLENKHKRRLNTHHLDEGQSFFLFWLK